MIGRSVKRILSSLAATVLAFGAPAHAQQAVEAAGPALWVVADEEWADCLPSRAWIPVISALGRRVVMMPPRVTVLPDEDTATART